MISVGVLLFDGVAVADFSHATEVFCVASHLRAAAGHSVVRCFMVAARMRPVQAQGGMKILPGCVLPPAPDVDILLVPGGDVAAALHQPELADWIAEQAPRTFAIAGIGSGNLLLARAGVLDGLPAAVRYQDRAQFRENFPKVRVQPAARWIDCGKVATCVSATVGTDVSLRLVARIGGLPLAQAVARHMAYRRNPDDTGESIHARIDAAHPGVFSAA